MSLVNVCGEGKQVDNNVSGCVLHETIECLTEDVIGQVLLGRPARHNVGNEFLGGYSLDSIGDVAIDGRHNLHLPVGSGSMMNCFIEKLPRLQDTRLCLIIILHDRKSEHG